ncbi:MAG: c-type cytochrome [Pseudorhodoferax sp.]
MRFFALLLALATGPAQADDAGRRLYEAGGAPAQQLSARTGADGSWVLRGAAVACANCHGLRADGGGEGTQRAPGLRWPAWSSLDAGQRAQARERLRQAVRHGRAADGRLLATAMPRFDIDDAALDALAAHLEHLGSQGRAQALPRLALLRLADGRAPAIEQDIDRRLRACLAERLRGSAELDSVDAASADDAARQWQRWQQRPEVLAAIAPPWRGWQPPAPSSGEPLPALFPLVADPAPGTPGALWLFGGAEARAVALVLAWLQEQAGPARLPVWAGAGRDAQPLLARIAQVVRQDGGRPLQWQPLAAPVLAPGQAGLWLADDAPPAAGWWLLPQPSHDAPGDGQRWWRATPYPGTPPQPLAARWAEAACATAQALLGQGIATRAQWQAALARQGRLRDGAGWEWSVPASDPAGYGASTGWTILDLQPGWPPRAVRPLVAIGRPPAEPRQAGR